MEWHDAGSAGISCERARLRGGEMAPFGGELRVLVQKGGLNEELVGAARELDDPCDVRLVERCVHDVDNSMSARGAQRLLLEHAEGYGQIVADDDRAVVRRPAPDRPLGLVQPRTDRKTQPIEPLLPHVDPQRLLKREGEAGRAVIEHDALDAKLLFLEQRSRRQRRRGELASLEGFAGAELADAANSIGVEFGHRQSKVERLRIEKIPIIGFQFVFDLIEETARTGQMQRRGTVQADPQQAIEASKMIHVSMGNENMTDAHELARGQRRHVAKIEEQGPAAESEVDEQRGIREGIIDEPRLHEPGHSIPLQLRGGSVASCGCHWRGFPWTLSFTAEPTAAGEVV